MRAWSGSAPKRLSATIDREVGERADRQPHRVDGAEAGVGDEHHEVGREQRARGRRCRRRSRSASAGRRRPRRGRRRRRRASRSRPTRSATVNGGSAELVGGHRRRPRRWRSVRCGGQTVSGSSPVAAASTSASVAVAGRRPTAPACARATCDARGAQLAGDRRGPPGLARPRSRCRATNTSVRGRVTCTSGEAARRARRRAGRPARRCARPRARPAAATSRAAPSAGGWR